MKDEKVYNLEERTRRFARNVRVFIKKLPKSIANTEDGKQLIRSSGSVGANYIEASDSLGSKDFTMHMRISRKETHESIHWLSLIDIENDQTLKREQTLLLKEADELMRIFGKIVRDRQ